MGNTIKNLTVYTYETFKYYLDRGKMVHPDKTWIMIWIPEVGYALPRKANHPMQKKGTNFPKTEINAIIANRFNEGNNEYLVSWLNKPNACNKWIKEANLR